ncbi:MFS transporter [Saccharopolyspora sp. CA-218241]|uniref:MFS transporter n=1 Tax=Saccharopolyspora sp. CA-218241 TaxID=3240027 RepID=UPI003D992BBC
MTDSADRQRFPRSERVFYSAAFAGGPMEVLEFILPLYSGAILGASPAEIGALVAVCAVAALVTRPLCGILVDRANKIAVAAAGALLHAGSLIGFAWVGGLAPAFAMAALSGIGGSFFWVGVRSWVGAESDPDGRGFGRLLSFEGTGALIAYVLCFVALEDLGYPAVFALGAASGVVAAVLLGFTVRAAAGKPLPEQDRPGEDRPAAKGLLPFLVVCGVTAALEAGMSLLLILHLQTEHQYGPYEIASVLAPGFIAFIVVPNFAHHVLARLGKRTAVVLALLASALVTGALATEPEPWVLGLVWILAAAALGIALPAEQSAVADRAGARIGQRISYYETAQLAGVAAGTAGVGALYQSAGIAITAAAAAVGLALTAAVVPRAWRALTTEAASPARGADTRVLDREHSRRRRRDWYWHSGVFVAGHGVLWLLGASSLAAGFGAPLDGPEWLTTVGRIWVIVYLVDAAGALFFTLFPRTAKNAENSETAPDNSG